MHVMTASYHGNPNIGLFCYANDRFCLVPLGFPHDMIKKFEDILKVPVHEMTAAGTHLLGVFFAGNEKCLLVPEIMFENELKELERLNINYKVLNTEFTALGNNLLVSDNVCIASPDYDERPIKEIEAALDVKVKKGQINGLTIVGSLAKLNKRGCLVGEAQDFEKKFLKDNLKVGVREGTLNFGSPYVSSALVCNSHGFVVGDMSGGPEIQNADEALGFI